MIRAVRVFLLLTLLLPRLAHAGIEILWSDRFGDVNLTYKVKVTKFDPAGDYIRRWVPELAEVTDVHTLGSARPARYPDPIVDHAEERLEALRRYQQLR